MGLCKETQGPHHQLQEAARPCDSLGQAASVGAILMLPAADSAIWAVFVFFAILLGPYVFWSIHDYHKERNPGVMKPKEYARYLERKGRDPNEH